MEPHIDVITLAVSDLGRSLEFYRDGHIYSGYFRDPDGHLWEILWNPRLDRPDA